MRSAKKARTGGILPPVLALAVVLLLAGCGGGSNSSKTMATGTAANTGDVDSTADRPDTDREAGAASDRTSSGKDAGSGPNGGSPGGKQSSGDTKQPDNPKQGSKAPQTASEPEPGITREQRSKATTASVTLESPSFAGGTPLPVQYTCDGRNESPPLRWSGVPGEAAELVLFVLNMNPVNEALFFDWAVAGLDPSIDSLQAGKLPVGAVEGQNSFGKRSYSICPPGQAENYIFMLYAIPTVLDPKAGFDPLPLREEILAQSGDVGLLSATYAQ
jgi:phosphatidylethanolamine-binding protein (PEBP) family uncharacterized protein